MREFLRKRCSPDGRPLDSPDGRPLYAYRCTDAEFVRMGEELTESLGHAAHSGDPPPSVSQAFCLWGAEWWRRNHEGGPWRWEDLLAAIDCLDHAPGGPHYFRLQRIVAEGIRQWQRELLRFARGRAFLVTLACEGGLPLKLVRRETAALRHYFKDLLEEIRISGHLGVAPRDLAERVAFRLPKRLRHDVVYELTGNLAAAIWRLQREVGESSNPVAKLDEIRPHWRDDLPLAVDDNVARTLLNNLILDAVDLARGRTGRIKWARSLNRTPDGYQLIGRLQLPGTLHGDELQALWPEITNPPRRFEIGIETADSLRVAAFATRGAEGESEHYVLENVLGDDGIVQGPMAADARKLFVRTNTGTTYTTDSFPGAVGLFELPWVFEDTGDPAEELRFVGEGSTSVRANAAVVAIKPETVVTGEGDSEIKEAGFLAGTDRRLVRVRGVAQFRDADGNLTVVRTSVGRGCEEIEYRVRGRELSLSRDGSTLFLGTPRVYLYRADGFMEVIPSSQLEWRSDLKGAGWEPLSEGCVGTGRIRCIRDGNTIFSQRVTIFPARTEIRFEPNRDGRSGTIVFHGIGATDVAVLDPPGLGVQLETAAHGGVRLTLEAPGQVPTDVDILVRWIGRGEALLSLPFPTQRAWFETASGRQIPNNVALAAERLGRVRAVAVVPGTSVSFNVEGSYRGKDAATVESRNRLLRQELIERAAGLYEADLTELRRTIESRLAFSSDETGHVRLVIRSNDVGGFEPPSLRVYRYDFEVAFDAERSKVVIPEDALIKLTAEEVSELRAEAIYLLSPQENRIPLDRHSNTSWHFPTNCLKPGPWLVLVWQGEWCRARPLWWFIRPTNLDGYAHHPLVELFRGRGTGETARRDAAAELVRRIRSDAGDPCWNIIDGQLELTAHVPSVSFDLLTALAADPWAAAFAALRAPNDVAFVRLWRALETLPFWWRAIPVSTWEEALTAFISSVGESLAPLRDALGDEQIATMLAQQVDTAIARFEGELAGVYPVLKRVAARCLGRQPDPAVTWLFSPDSLRELMRERNSRSEAWREQVSRVPWHIGLETVSELATELRQFPWSRDFFIQANRQLGERAFELFNAPVVAALCAVTDKRLEPRAVYQLRTLAELLPDWFSEVYDRTFWCAYGLLAQMRIRDLMTT